jgi:hypothetical protein
VAVTALNKRKAHCLMTSCSLVGYSEDGGRMFFRNIVYRQQTPRYHNTGTAQNVKDNAWVCIFVISVRLPLSTGINCVSTRRVSMKFDIGDYSENLSGENPDFLEI